MSAFCLGRIRPTPPPTPGLGAAFHTGGMKTPGPFQGCHSAHTCWATVWTLPGETAGSGPLLRLTVVGKTRGAGRWSQSTACMLPRVPSPATGRGGDTLPSVLVTLALKRLQQCNFITEFPGGSRQAWVREEIPAGGPRIITSPGAFPGTASRSSISALHGARDLPTGLCLLGP